MLGMGGWLLLGAFVCSCRLLAEGSNARTISLDLLAQWKALALSANGQFRFTPPTHVLLALRQAIAEHVAEGGQPGRLARCVT